MWLRVPLRCSLSLGTLVVGAGCGSRADLGAYSIGDDAAVPSSGGNAAAGGSPSIGTGGRFGSSGGRSAGVGGASTGGAGGLSAGGGATPVDASAGTDGSARDAQQDACSPSGECGKICDSGSVSCVGAVVGLQTDRSNCGSCGHDCLGGECSDGNFQPFAVVTNQYNPIYVAVNATDLYWTTGTGGVLSAPISGGPAVKLYSGKEAEGIALDSSFVYWSTYLGGTILRMPLHGGPVTTLLTPTTRPLGIAVDSTHLYFTTFYGDVMVMPITGGTPVTFVPATSNAFVGGIAVNAVNVVWGSWPDVVEVPLAGGTPTVLVTGQPTQSSPVGIALDGLNVYWANEYGGLVAKAPITGGPPTVIVSGFSTYAGGVAVDSVSIYWTASDATNVGSIMRLAK